MTAARGEHGKKARILRGAHDFLHAAAIAP